MSLGAGIAREEITGLILAGGQGRRMGGVDKGLQRLDGEPLVYHALRRLAPQVGGVLISANRHLADYAALGVPVLPDTLPDFPGPLAGWLAGLERCPTPWLMTVPCDTPRFPLDGVARLAEAAWRSGSDVAWAATWENDEAGGPPRLRAQPVFCLLRRTLAPRLAAFVASGERRVGHWLAQQTGVRVAFEDAGAFVNANTLDELAGLSASLSAAPPGPPA